MSDAPPAGLRAAPPRVNLPWIESPFFAGELARRAGELTEADRTLAEQYRRDGYVALPQVVPHELCDRVLAECEPFFEEEWSIQHRRVQDAWRRDAASVRELAVFPEVLRVLEMLYERRPVPFQTLDFKWGTEQHAHSDSIHFSCLPARYMCGVWVALEDVGPGNGPLFYHPGSHRLPEITAYDLGQTVHRLEYDPYEDYQHALMDELGIEAVEFHAKKGDALIWGSNIVHGGRPVLDEGSTRWSQVTHFYFADCIYYTPFFSDVALGELSLKDIVDLTSLEPVQHRYNQTEVTVEKLPNGRSRVRDADPSAAATAAGSGTSAMSAMSADATAVPAPDEQVATLQADLAAARADADAARREVADLRSSRSYRLGNAVVAPLRRLIPR